METPVQERLQIRCLGRLQVTLLGAPLHDLHRAPTLCTLLGYFILHRGEVLDRWRVAGTFWPDLPDSQARRNLNTLLWRLRQIAGGVLVTCLQSTPHTLMWNLPSDAWLDLDEFEACTVPVAPTPEHEFEADEETLKSLEQAVRLYRGPLLTGCDAEWCYPPRLRYQERYLRALEVLITGYEASGDLVRALHYAEELVRAEPYDEAGHEAVIRLHLALGQHQAALTAYQRYARIWREELGLSPADRVTRLLRLPARGAPTLDTLVGMPLALANLARLLVDPKLSHSVMPAVRQMTQRLGQALVVEAEQVGEVAEAQHLWEIARQAYETALVALEDLAPTSANLRHQLTLRLRCDPLYDRAAQRQAQARNLEQALSLAETLADSDVQSEVRARQCWLAQREGRLQEALRLAEAALELAEDDSHLRAQALRLMGTCYEMLGRYPLALAYHQKALALDADRPEWRRLDHNNLASVYTYLGHDWLALEQARLALALTPESPATLVRAIILGNMASAERELGDFIAAMNHLQAAQRLANILGNRETQVWLACRAARLYSRTGDRDRARLWAVYARRRASELADSRYEVEAALELASLAGQQGLLDEARRWINRADSLSGGEECSRYQGAIALLRCQLGLAKGYVEAAAEAVATAWKALKASGEERHQVLAHTLEAVVAHHQGDGNRAIRGLEEARCALLERASEIPSLAERDRFLRSTPLRRMLADGDFSLILETLRQAGAFLGL